MWPVLDTMEKAAQARTAFAVGIANGGCSGSYFFLGNRVCPFWQWEAVHPGGIVLLPELDAELAQRMGATARSWDFDGHAIDTGCPGDLVFIGVLGAQHGECERAIEQLRGLPEVLSSVRSGLYSPA